MNSIKIILAFPISFDCFIVFNPGVCVELASIGSARGEAAARGAGCRKYFHREVFVLRQCTIRSSVRLFSQFLLNALEIAPETISMNHNALRQKLFLF